MTDELAGIRLRLLAHPRADEIGDALLSASIAGCQSFLDLTDWATVGVLLGMLADTLGDEGVLIHWERAADAWTSKADPGDYLPGGAVALALLDAWGDPCPE